MAWHSRHHHRGGSPGESPRSRFRVASKPRLSQTLRSQTSCTPFLAGKFRHHSPHHLLSIGFLHAGICSPWFIHVHPLKSPPKLRIQKFLAKQGTDVIFQQYMSYHVFILEESLKTPDVSGICFDSVWIHPINPFGAFHFFTKEGQVKWWHMAWPRGEERLGFVKGSGFWLRNWRWNFWMASFGERSCFGQVCVTGCLFLCSKRSPSHLGPGRLHGLQLTTWSSRFSWPSWRTPNSRLIRLNLSHIQLQPRCSKQFFCSKTTKTAAVPALLSPKTSQKHLSFQTKTCRQNTFWP